MELQLDLDLEPGRFYGLYGRSGVGKTSILRIIAGLMKPERGRVEVGGECWFDATKKINLKPQKREAGLIFQDYALFPNMTVEENLRFALKKGEPDAVVHELINTMELVELRHRKPETLSGGQKQRVAVARALVQRPKLLLLDEPLAALDQEMRSKLQAYILKVHREFNLTSILVSHDPDEMQRMADRVFVLEEGKVVREGNPDKLFQNLSDPLYLSGRIIEVTKKGEWFRLMIETETGTFSCTVPQNKAPQAKPGSWVKLSIS